MPDKSTEKATLRQGELKTDEVLIHLEGAFTTATTGAIWEEAVKLAARTDSMDVVLDLSGVDTMDGAGVGLLAELHRSVEKRGGELRLIGLSKECESLLTVFQFQDVRAPDLTKKKRPLAVEVGVATVDGFRVARATVSFLGELTVGLFRAGLRPRSIRWRDMMVVAEKCGANALPIVSLLGFLIGLIIAYQSADLLLDFGVEVYVADMVGISMLRELGPIMAAIMLAARSGSAFAAEIGTMKVNEEVDALTTMGLDPIQFLAVPRMVAGVLVTPLLTIFCTVAGVLGGAVVAVASLDLSFVFYADRLMNSVSLSDLLSGLFKSVFFGILIAAVGCQMGLRTKGSPSAVGDSATSAVVAGIMLVIVADGVFAVLFSFLGIF